MSQQNTFIIDCPTCRAKVAAIEDGRTESAYLDEDGHPHCVRLHVGKCPRCKTLLAGESKQVRFENFDSEYDEFSDVVRVYPKPPKTFSSPRIPTVATESLLEAERSLQAGAHIAACAMLGRALEALCRDVLRPAQLNETEGKRTRPIMLAEGIRQLKEKNITTSVCTTGVRSFMRLETWPHILTKKAQSPVTTPKIFKHLSLQLLNTYMT